MTKMGLQRAQIGPIWALGLSKASHIIKDINSKEIMRWPIK